MLSESAALEAIETETPITSREGLDVNHASRARIQFLAAQSNALITQTQFADAKAAAMMTISGLIILNGPVQAHTISSAGPVALLAYACIAACLGGCFLSIIPRFPNAEHRRKIYALDRYSWPGLVDRHHDEADFPEFMRFAEASQLVLSLARANQATARILHRKFSILRITFLLGLAGVLLIGLHSVIGLTA